MRKNRLSFAGKLNLAFGTAFALIFIIAGVYLSRTFSKQNLEQQRQELLTEARLVSHSIPVPDVRTGDSRKIHELLTKIGGGARVRLTVIDPEGKVLGDSERTWEELQEMDNHRLRPEVQAAFRGESTFSRRWSRTLGTSMLYAAIPLEDRGQVIGVLRTAVSLDRVEEALSQVRRPVIFGMAAGILLVFVLGRIIGRSVTRRVTEMTRVASRYAEGDMSEKIHIGGNDELRLLAVSLNQMAASLKTRIRDREAEKANLTAILENMDEGVIAVDENRDVLFANPAAEALFEITPGGAGRSLLSVTRKTKIEEIMVRAIEEGERVVEEIEITHPEHRILRASALGMAGRGGSVCGLLVLSDITRIRQLESMRREFVANVSHELRTPLTSLRGFIETLLGGALEDREASERFLRMMEDDARRLERLIGDLLELSRLEARQSALRLQSLDLVHEVRQVAGMMEPRMKEKGILCESFPEGTAPIPVYADADRLRQVLINLFDNAIKFNRPGGSVRISAVPVGGLVRISVADTGIGIPEQAQERIFERFFRVDKARSREMGGTGLGLSIVKHIVEAHGGKVWCESRPGEGSVFIFTLPPRAPK